MIGSSDAGNGVREYSILILIPHLICAVGTYIKVPHKISVVSKY